MKRRKTWIAGTGVVCALLVGAAVAYRRSRPNHPFDFVAGLPVKLINGSRPIPGRLASLDSHPFGTLVYEIQIPMDQFERRLWEGWKAEGKPGDFNNRGVSVQWDHLVGNDGSYLTLSKTVPPRFRWGANDDPKGFVIMQKPMHRYPIGFLGGVAWTLTDKP